MSAKRAGAKVPSTSSTSAGFSPALANLLLVGAAVSYGLYLLVMRGRVSWPPHDLLASVYTVAGCLALVGPFVLARADSGERGLGELLWMTGGLLIWVFDAAAAVRGTWRLEAWATPLGYEAMGMTMLAVLLGGWRCRLGSRHWSWTNVTGWVLGLFWVAMAFTSLVPARVLGVASR
jgi:hypothetical protein